MENIGATLKQIRKSKKFTRKTVAELLRQKGFDISDKTLYGYEIGRTNANADLFMALCQIYGIENILEVFGYDYAENRHIPFDISEEEKELISLYRNLDKKGKQTIKETLRKECEYLRLKEYAVRLSELNNKEE